jgi:hypothetical protein
MVFAKNFRFCENFQPEFRIWIHIQVAPESGSAFQMENYREKSHETENLRKNKNFRGNENIRENFATFLKLVLQKAKKIFVKFS